jgi:hypothetical protein
MRNSCRPDVNAMALCCNCGLLRLCTSGQTPGSAEHSLRQDIDCIFTNQYQFLPQDRYCNDGCVRTVEWASLFLFLIDRRGRIKSAPLLTQFDPNIKVRTEEDAKLGILGSAECRPSPEARFLTTDRTDTTDGRIKYRWIGDSRTAVAMRKHERFAMCKSTTASVNKALLLRCRFPLRVPAIPEEILSTEGTESHGKGRVNSATWCTSRQDNSRLRDSGQSPGAFSGHVLSRVRAIKHSFF